MPTVAELQARLEKLRDLRAEGVRSVREAAGGGERSVEYKTDAEMAAAIADLEKQIAAAQSRGVNTVRFSTSKGF